MYPKQFSIAALTASYDPHVKRSQADAITEAVYPAFRRGVIQKINNAAIRFTRCDKSPVIRRAVTAYGKQQVHGPVDVAQFRGA